MGNGSRFGIKIEYIVQNKPKGLPDAFVLGKKFINNQNVALILGDNFFYGQSLAKILEKSSQHKNGAKIFLKEVTKPENYGVAKIKRNEIVKIIEKPKKFISNQAITGLYFFDKSVVKFSETLKPSKRGEVEITDLIKKYHKIKKLNFEQIGRGAIWSDAGKIKDLNNVSNYVKSVEEVQGIKIACLEEIALKKKWINTNNISQSIKFYGNCDYSIYLKQLLV